MVHVAGFRQNRPEVGIQRPFTVIRNPKRVGQPAELSGLTASWRAGTTNGGKSKASDVEFLPTHRIETFDPMPPTKSIG